MQNEQFITIQGWMRNELGLKGNELLVYALIYGFSQDEESEFTGSIGYISDWTGATKQTVHNTLKSLHEKELLHKEESFIKGVKYCSYRAILPPVKKFDGGSQKILPGVVKKFDGGSQKILPNSIEDNIERKYKDSNSIYSRERAEVIEYLNEVCGTDYKATSKKTVDLINARLKEGFAVEDFKTVIYKKAKQWMDDPKMCKYLRPETLFSNKFEGYLNEKAPLTFEERLAMA